MEFAEDPGSQERRQRPWRSGFSRRLRFERQSSLIVGRGAASDVLPDMPDPNPIVNQGCPRSVGGIESAKILCGCFGIDFKLEPLDCDPFLHGYGEECSDARPTIGVWRMTVTDRNRRTVSIPFYVVTGSGVLLLGNEICRRSNFLGTKNLIQVPKGLLSSSEHFLNTYSEPVGPRGTKGFRTYLSVIPSKVDHFRSYLSFCSFKTAHEALKGKFNTEEGAKRFATKLHTYSHLRVEEMRELCKRAGVYTKKLDDALKLAVEKCSSCKATGRPRNNRSIALGKVLS